jgi:DNA-binding response OmpR family regulator
MQGTILVYGNESMLVTTRRLVLEKAGYKVFASTEFADAILALTNERIDVLLLCQSLRDEERRGMLETAHAITRDVKCVILSYKGRTVPREDAEVVEGLEGPSTLLKAIEKLLAHKAV